MITFRIPTKELYWILPFICVGLMLMSLSRPLPVFLPPAGGRIVVDAKGQQVVIPPNFKGVVPLAWMADFLQKTHAPEMLVNAGSPEGQNVFAYNHWQRSLMDWVFPRVLRDDSLWDFPNDLESILAYDQEGYVYLNGFFWLGQSRFDDIHQRFGLTSVSLQPPSYDDVTNDEVIAMRTRIMNDIIGQKEKAEIYLADYKRDIAELITELDIQTLGHRPLVLAIGSDPDDWIHLDAGDRHDPRLGLPAVMKGKRALGREQDVERILFANPDIILSHPASFTVDPRWRGLKAVREKRVYGGTRFSPYQYDLNFQPLGLRHFAELVYPERLKPKLRIMMREKFENYGYRLKDYEIDWLLNLEANGDSVGYLARFGPPSQMDDSVKAAP